MKTPIQILYDNRFFEYYDSADEVLKDFVLFAKHRPDLEPKKDDNVIQ